MRRAGQTLLAIGLPALVLAACAREERRATPSPRPPYQAPQRVAPGPTLSSAAYMASAASIDLFEIRSSELALQRSTNNRFREFASMMIAAHKGTGSQLSFAGRRLNLLPSAILNAKHQAMLDQLEAAANFDSTYRQQQLAVHQEALAMHRNYSLRGTSPTLRPVAAAIVPIVERHLRLVRYL